MTCCRPVPQGSSIFVATFLQGSYLRSKVGGKKIIGPGLLGFRLATPLVYLYSFQSIHFTLFLPILKMHEGKGQLLVTHLIMLS